MALRSRTAMWFEATIRYEKVMEDGLQKKVSENYTVDAMSFEEAEKRIIEEMSSYISGEFYVTEEKVAQYKDIVFSPSLNADKWYKSKVQLITIDEKTEKEKKTNCYYLVQASSLEEARETVERVMSSLCDYTIAAIVETKIVDVFTE